MASHVGVHGQGANGSNAARAQCVRTVGRGTSRTGLLCGGMQTDLERPDNPREPVAPPAMPERDGERDHLRPSAPRYTIEVANKLREQVVRVEFPDDQLQERARPLQLR